MAPSPSPSSSVSRKRAVAVKIEAGASPATATSIARPSKVARRAPSATTSSSTTNNTTETKEELQERFLSMFSESAYTSSGVSNSALKAQFGQTDYVRLAPIINSLLADSRLTMSRGGGKNELFYTLVSSETASKFAGLDVSARLVYQVIEKAGNMGIWTKDIKKETNIQNQALNKIFKTLESRRLIKPVKSIAAKAKKLYMLFELTPSTELTGGIWYSDLEFDFGFITELRNFLMQCVRKLNQGRGVTLAEILEKIKQGNISKVHLGLTEVGQIMQTLVYDYAVDTVHPDENDHEDDAQPYYVASRRVATMCDFKMWADVLAPDFHFRSICFEDGVTLQPHEPHYHS